jgi:hypothetical protein
MDIFEKASRLKTRFPTTRGMCPAEDLWDLPLSELDGVFKIINKDLKVFAEDSLLVPKGKGDSELALKIDIITHVVRTKQAEADSAQQAKVKAAEEQKLLGILDMKRASQLESLSVEEIEARLAALKKE